MDILLKLQADQTISAITTTNSTGINIGLGGTGRRVGVARIWYSVTSATASTITWSIEHSTALAGTYYACASGAKDVVTASAGKKGEVYILFATDLAFIRLVMVTAGTAINVTYGGTFTIAAP
jgi:hypothetical protein